MFDFQKDCGLTLIKDMIKADENISRIYGFILYTDNNPYIAKVLSDDFFWNALNAKSGPNWPIFAVRPLEQGKRIVKGGGSGVMSMMISTWDEPKYNIPILRDFGLEDSEDLPLFVAFMWDDNDNLNQISIQIPGKTVDEVYHNLDEIVSAITRVERKVEPDYKRTVNVFRNVAAELDYLRFKFKMINRGKIIMKIAEFLSVFR